MPAPLEATETLMPELMDVDKVRYLFETRMRVRGNFDVRDCTWFPTISVPIGRRGCKMTQRLDWFFTWTLIELATDSYVTINFDKGLRPFQDFYGTRLVTASRAQRVPFYIFLVKVIFSFTSHG